MLVIFIFIGRIKNISFLSLILFMSAVIYKYTYILNVII